MTTLRRGILSTIGTRPELTSERHGLVLACDWQRNRQPQAARESTTNLQMARPGASSILAELQRHQLELEHRRSTPAPLLSVSPSRVWFMPIDKEGVDPSAFPLQKSHQ